MRCAGGLGRSCLPAVLALLVVAACSSGSAKGGPKTAGPNPSIGRSAASPSRQGEAPSSLVGVWKVSGAAGEQAGSVLRIAPNSQGDGLILFRPCGEIFGGWQATPSGSFLGNLSGYSMACRTTIGSGDPTPPWIASARSYAVADGKAQLLAADGRVLATLLPGGQAHAGKDMLPALAETPRLSAAERSKLDAVAKPLPSGSVAATAATLSGRWRPYPVKHYNTPQRPYLSFTAAGPWTGSDGCNKLAGTVEIGPDGEFISISGAFAGVGCLGPSLTVPLSGRAGLSGNLLTLYDGNGRVVDTLTR